MRSPSACKTVLVLDGDHRDQVAIGEAAARCPEETDLLEIFVVPFRINEWAHWELGDNPDLLRFQIEFEQIDTVATMIEAVGIKTRWRAHLLRSRWRIDDQLRAELGTCDHLIISTSSPLVRRRTARLARRAQVRPTFTPRARGQALGLGS